MVDDTQSGTQQAWATFDEWLRQWRADHPDDDREAVDLIDEYAAVRKPLCLCGCGQPAKSGRKYASPACVAEGHFLGIQEAKWAPKGPFRTAADHPKYESDERTNPEDTK
jgi:hypothetical protein